jgi:hypothetical protein
LIAFAAPVLEVPSLQIARPKRAGELLRCFPRDRSVQCIDRRNGPIRTTGGPIAFRQKLHPVIVRVEIE